MIKQGLGTRAAVAGLVVGLALLAGPATAGVAAEGPVNLLDVSVDTDGGMPVVYLDADGPVRYESFLLDEPYRLVVDLPGVVNRADSSRLTVLEGGLVQVRVAQFQMEPMPVTRVVMDLDAPLAHTAYAEGSRLSISLSEAGTATPAVAEQLPEWATPDDSAEQAGDPVVTLLAGMDDEAAAEPVPEPEPESDPQSATVEVVTAEPQVVPEIDSQPAAEPVAVASTEEAEDNDTRSIGAEAIEELLSTPQLAAEPAPESGASAGSNGFETRTISGEAQTFTGKRISLNLVDANIKEVFRLFHEISGINFVLDPSVEGRVTIVVDNVPWDQALDLILKNNGLDKIIENNVIRIATTQKLANEAAQRKALKEAKELEVEPITITRTLSYAKAKDVERVIREGGVLSQRGKVIVDERTNTLIISDIPKKVDPLDQLISTLDSETPQVMIEARVVETSRSFSRDLGVVWGFAAVADSSRGTQTGVAFPSQASVKYGLNLPGKGTASNLAFKFGNIIDSFTLDIALNTLETEGRGRILSSPKVATQNNERAEIEQGVRIPIVNTTATEINVEFVSASLRMEVTPQITAEGTVILDVIVENNSPDFVNTVGEVPPINTQRAQTKVLIEDGGTTVIGGIFVVNEGENEIGVPWFRKIPVFGWLFKNRSITRENRELLIFITPKIMKLS